jgi:BlaI family transcriptional regulator, penicillinase repressor
MKILWQLRSATFKTVVDRLKSHIDWNPKTVHTLLSRLVEKGALARKDAGREYVFTPKVSERDCRAAASRSFLARVFDGEIAPLVACFLEHKELSRADIDELRNLLEDQ